jgi:hypothetical protein
VSPAARDDANVSVLANDRAGEPDNPLTDFWRMTFLRGRAAMLIEAA